VDFVAIDGSRGEGGGQILRTAVTFSAILQKPVSVTKIRAGRGEPGLRRQHLSALLVLAKVFGGRLEGASEGSSAIRFVPGDANVDSLSVDMGTAASITLVLQAVVPAVALSGRKLRLELKGGTDVPWSPTFDYFATVVRRAYARIGIKFGTEASRRGYYPRGGGEASCSVDPCPSISPLNLVEQERILGADLLSRCGSLSRHVAERQLSAASTLLEESGFELLSAGVSEEPSDSPGTSMLTYSAARGAYLGADGIGARGKPAEEVGRETASKFVAEAASGACLDSNLADMVLPLLSLGKSPSKVRVGKVTSHLQSGMDIASMFTSCSWSVDSGAKGTVITITPSKS
jgi:RNA 3'-phosphate cyclase